MSVLLRFLGLSPDHAGRVTGVELMLRGGTGSGWVILLAVALAGLVVLLYRREQSVAPWRRYVLAGLRAAFVVLLVGLLLRPTLRLTAEGTIRRALVVLVDGSASMKIADPRTEPADLARAAIAAGLLDPAMGLNQTMDGAKVAEVQNLARTDLLKSALRNEKLDLLDRIGREYDVRPFVFGRTLTELANDTSGGRHAWVGSLPADSPLTAAGDAVRELLSRTRGQPLAGVLLASDGAINAGSPALAAAELARQEGVPLYVWGVGIASPKDVILANLFSPDVAFINDEVQAVVRVRSQGLAGQGGEVVLKLGDEVVVRQTVGFSADSAEQVVGLRFAPKRAGEFDLGASIEPRPDEVVKDNNRQTQRLRVIDGKIKVLLVETQPRWEFKYLQALLLRDRRVELKCVLLEGDPAIASGPGSPYLARFPTSKEDLFGYDLVIFGDVDPRNLAAAQLEALHEFVSKFGGGFLMIAGRNFSPWGYRHTPVEKMLPVEWEEPARSGAARADEVADKPIRPELTDPGRRSPMLRLADTEQESAAAWAKLPPLYWTARVSRHKPAAEVLLVDPDPARSSRFGKMPILAVQQYGLGQAMFLGTDNTWRWRRNVGDRHAATLWGQIVQRLALPHLLGESKRTQLSTDRQHYMTGDRVTIYARLYNDAFEPVAEASVRGAYTIDAAPARQPVLLAPLPGQPGMYRGEFTAPVPGSYRFAVERDDKTTLHITVAEPKLELGETAMNEPLLRQMAEASGGRFFREEDLHELPDAVGHRTDRISSSLDVEIWSSPLYFLTLLAVVTAEWVMRKVWQLK